MRIPEHIERRLIPPPQSYSVHNSAAFRRHGNAVREPIGFEVPILLSFWSLEHSAHMHRDRYGSPIGDDAVLGGAWETMARGLIRMLDGEAGRLDCGLVDAAIRLLASDNGITIE